ncbi:hypothetical protein GQ44DRAFT_723692 [Phaeosphaeriaceae sp. PMI808]|nr:hypothetical protein GQ44DRAFT_723692 [Phaeosphaeriaceae sp. PMI808]
MCEYGLYQNTQASNTPPKQISIRPFRLNKELSPNAQLPTHFGTSLPRKNPPSTDHPFPPPPGPAHLTKLPVCLWFVRHLNPLILSPPPTMPNWWKAPPPLALKQIQMARSPRLISADADPGTVDWAEGVLIHALEVDLVRGEGVLEPGVVER